MDHNKYYIDPKRFKLRLNHRLTKVGIPPKNYGRAQEMLRRWRDIDPRDKKISAQRLQEWINGTAVPSSERWDTLEELLEAPIEWILWGKGSQYDAVQEGDGWYQTAEERDLLELFRNLRHDERPKAFALLGTLRESS